MKTLLQIGAFAFGLGVSACSNSGGGTPGAGNGNRAACEAYVNTFNALSCVPAAANQNASTACPAALDSSTCDASTYYDCLTSSLACMNVGGTSVLDTSAIAGCGTTSPCR